MEERIQSVIEARDSRRPNLRTDIRYRRVAGSHVVLELKRGSRRLAKTDIEKQLKKYMRAVKQELNKDPDQRDLTIDGICLVGKLPQGWDNPELRKEEEESFRALRIRVMTYDELINNARSAYAKFLRATAKTAQLNVLLDRIRNFTPQEEA